MLLSKKKSRGHHFHYVSYTQGCHRLQKNLGLRFGSGRNDSRQRLLCRNTFLHIICIGKYGKTVKNAHFDVLNPLNDLFGANLVSYPQGGVAKDFLRPFWKIQNVFPGGGRHKDVKNDHF